MRNAPPETALTQDILNYARHHLRGWRGLVALAAVAAVPAFWLGGPWLVATGAMSILVALAPCLVMCALGICVMKSCNKSGAETGATDKHATTDSAAAAVAPAVTDSTSGLQQPPATEAAPQLKRTGT